MNEPFVVSYWDPTEGKAVDTVTTLEEIIQNPAGFKMDHVGLMLFNKERKARGLTEYKLNPKTGTYDEAAK